MWHDRNMGRYDDQAWRESLERRLDSRYPPAMNTEPRLTTREKVLVNTLLALASWCLFIWIGSSVYFWWAK